MSSFALQTKESLCNINVKGLCCKKAQLFGILFYGAKFGIDEITLYTESEPVAALTERFLLECFGGVCDIEYYSGGIRVIIKDKNTLSALMSDKRKHQNCPKCNINYLRGIFLACASINDPAKSYRLEFALRRNTDELTELLGNIPVFPKQTLRKGVNVVYIKESESIEDLLNYIGATTAAFALMNEKIKKEIRNSINRANNCDTANIGKAITASRKHIDAILKLKEQNRLGVLPENIRITAQLRIENPDASLQELADMHEPKITKSGLNNRLKKIIEFSKEV